MSRVLASLALLAQLAVTAYLSLVAWLLSAWFVDDSTAFGMTTQDWVVTALVRFGEFFAIACVFGAVAYVVNGWVVGTLFPHRHRLRLHLSVGLAAVIMLASASGAVQFAVTRPYM